MPTPSAANPLIVDVDEIARQLKLDRPVDDDTAETIRQAILDAQADVEAYLGRPIVPQIRTVTGVFAVPPMWAWRVGAQPDPRVHDGLFIDDDDYTSLISATAETYPGGGPPTGLYTVVYWAGLDARNDAELREIVRWVSAAARNAPAVLDVWSEFTRLRGFVTNVSVDGQSASFAAPWHGQGTVPGSGAPGAMPTLEALYRWKKHGVYQRRTGGGDSWAFDDRVGYGPWGV